MYFTHDICTIVQLLDMSLVAMKWSGCNKLAPVRQLRTLTSVRGEDVQQV